MGALSTSSARPKEITEMKNLLLSILLALSTTGCQAVSKNPSGTQQVSPNVSQATGMTITWAEKGMSFTVRQNWHRDKMDEDGEMTWVGPGNARILIRVAPYKPEYGYTSIEYETDKFYEDHKKYGEEDLRYLEINGIRGVHYLRDEKGWDESYHPQDEKVIIWDAQRMYKGRRQIIFVNVRSPAKAFTKDRDTLYGLLQSIKFSPN
jgi:hypothetical protein